MAGTNLDVFKQIHCDSDNIKLLRFNSFVEAQNLYTSLSVVENPIIPAVLELIQDPNQGFFVALEQTGEFLRGFLQKRSNKFLFFDCLEKNVLLKRSGFQQIKYGREARVGVRISPMYQAILRDLILGNSLLNEEHFLCNFNLDSVKLSFNDGYSDGRLMYGGLSVFEFELRDTEANGDQWRCVLQLVNSINSSVAFPVANKEMDLLRDRLENRSIENILEIPLFWTSTKRIHFIRNLCGYMKINPTTAGQYFWTANLDGVFGLDWEATLSQYRVMDVLIQEYDDDRKREKLPARDKDPPIPPITDAVRTEELSKCLECLHNILEHVDTLLNNIHQHDPNYLIKNAEDVQLLFEHVFPNHIQLLVNRVNDLGIKF